MRNLTSHRSRTVTVAVMASLLATTACHSLRTRSYPPTTIPADSTQMIVGATTLSGEQIVFDRRTPARMDGGQIVGPVAGARVEDNAIVGTTDGVPRAVPLADVRDVKTEERRLSLVRTAALVGAAAYLFGAVVFAVSGGY